MWRGEPGRDENARDEIHDRGHGSAIRDLQSRFDGRQSSTPTARAEEDPLDDRLGRGCRGRRFASITTFGSKVTVVELLPRLIPIEDASLGAELERAFKKRGIGVHVTRSKGRQDADGVKITASKTAGDQAQAECSWSRSVGVPDGISGSKRRA
jgi:hypothetical protein